MYEIGFRCVELLVFWISDIGIDIDNLILLVVRRYDSKDDFRLKELIVKILGRVVFIIKEFRDLLNIYIKIYCNDMKVVKIYLFIFVFYKDKEGYY